MILANITDGREVVRPRARRVLLGAWPLRVPSALLGAARAPRSSRSTEGEQRGSRRAVLLGPRGRPRGRARAAAHRGRPSMSDQMLSSKMVVQEEDSGVRGIAGASTTVCGAVGIAERGPVGKATLLLGPARLSEPLRPHPAHLRPVAGCDGLLHECGGQRLALGRAHRPLRRRLRSDDGKGDAATGWLSAVHHLPATVVAANAAPMPSMTATNSPCPSRGAPTRSSPSTAQRPGRGRERWTLRARRRPDARRPGRRAAGPPGDVLGEGVREHRARRPRKRSLPRWPRRSTARRVTS